MKLRQESMRRLISVILLAVMMLVFGLTNNAFFAGSNLLKILREASLSGMIAVGVTFVIITAGIDLSTGAIVGLCGMLCANLLYNYNLPWQQIFLISIVTGTLCGTLKGFSVTKLRVPEFIATLSAQYLYRSLVFVFAIREGGVISNKKIESYPVLILGGSINGFYLVSMVFILFAVIGQILLKSTRFGTYVYATGANRKSAELSGINVAWVRWRVFIITGFLCGVAALFQMGRIGSVTTDMGTGLEFDVIAAVVVGGCAFSGGRGDVFGSVIGAIFMAVLQNGILKYNFPTAVQLIMKGVVIVIMVIFDSVYNSFIQKRIQQAVQNEDAAQTQKGGAAVV